MNGKVLYTPNSVPAAGPSIQLAVPGVLDEVGLSEVNAPHEPVNASITTSIVPVVIAVTVTGPPTDPVVNEYQTSLATNVASHPGWDWVAPAVVAFKVILLTRLIEFAHGSFAGGVEKLYTVQEEVPFTPQLVRT